VATSESEFSESATVPASENLTSAPDPRGPAFISRPWFWVLFIGSLFTIPLIKGVGADFPAPLPGIDRAPYKFELQDEAGTTVRMSDLAGYLVVATELPLASGSAHQYAMLTMRAIRKRLRGLGSSVVFIMLSHGGGADELSAVLDEWNVRKPVNVFLLDNDREAMSDLRHEGASASADWFLLDRHGRLRGAYGVGMINAPGNDQSQSQQLIAVEKEMDRLVLDAGQLANWSASDPPPEQP